MCVEAEVVRLWNTRMPPQSVLGPKSFQKRLLQWKTTQEIPKGCEVSERNAYLNSISAAWLGADGFRKRCCLVWCICSRRAVVPLQSVELPCSRWSRGYSCSKQLVQPSFPGGSEHMSSSSLRGWPKWVKKRPGNDAVKPASPLVFLWHVTCSVFLIVNPILLLEKPLSGFSFGSLYSYSLPHVQLFFLLWMP